MSKSLRLTAPWASDHLLPPARLEGSDLPKYSKVIGRPLWTCEALEFAAFNASDIVVSFEVGRHLTVVPPTLTAYAQPPMYPLADEPAESPQHGQQRGDIYFPPTVPLHDWTNYFVPYAILSLAVIALIMIAIRNRRDRIANKRIPV